MSVQLAVLIAKTKEDLLDIAADGMLKMEFNSQKINVFWMKRKEEYPKLAREALKLSAIRHILPMCTTVLFNDGSKN
jgi:hypothetical protein